MNRLIVTVGLPRSGKSTWAKEQNLPIVNRDSIRLAHHGEAFLAPCEDFITVLENTMVSALFLAGNETIIIDATHGTERRRNKWKNFKGVDEVLFKEFFTSVPVCIARTNETNAYLIPVIERMYKTFEDLDYGRDLLYDDQKVSIKETK